MAILVLNMGLKSIRSIVFDYEGRKLSFANLPIETKIKGDFVTQDANEWWDKAVKVIRKSLEEPNVRNRVEYMTVTSSSSCLVPINRDGFPLHDAIMVSDKRARSEARVIGQIPEFSKVAKETGLSMDPYLMLPKILWLRNHEPALYENTDYFLSSNDFFVYRLTHHAVTDELNAQKYHYNMDEKKYPEILLRKLEIPSSKLPQVLTPGSYAGELIESVAEQFGFSKSVHVILSTYDAICAFIGSGPKESGEACDVSGTVTSLRVFSNNRVDDPAGRVLNTPFSDRLHIVGGSNNLGGGLIEWVKQCYYHNESYPYEIMEMEARESVDGAKGLIFLPYLMGERTPIWDADARGVFFGIERFHTRKDMTRAVFESAGFAIRTILDVLHEHDIPIESVRISGGLSRISLISQIKADITGKNMIVVDEFETTALGAAIIVAAGIGKIGSVFEAADLWVKKRMIIIPNQQKHEFYNEMYALFKESYKTLQDLFKRRSEIVHRIYEEKIESVENL